MIHTRKIYIIAIFSFLITACQTEPTGRSELRLGNRQYNSGSYNKAESHYLKSSEKEQSLEAFYGIGNSIQRQYISLPADQIDKMDSVATQAYNNGLAVQTQNQLKKASTYHNLGNLAFNGGIRYKKMQNINESNKKFNEAVDFYKSSLRINPEDNETRYNLAMAIYMINKNKQEQQKDQQDNKDKQNNKDKQDNKDQNKENGKQQNSYPQLKGGIDKKTAEQLLNAAQQDENKVQKKVEKATVGNMRFEKDW